jgi:hypothetical protein
MKFLSSSGPSDLPFRNIENRTARSLPQARLERRPEIELLFGFIPPAWYYVNLDRIGAPLCQPQNRYFWICTVVRGQTSD